MHYVIYEILTAECIDISSCSMIIHVDTDVCKRHATSKQSKFGLTNPLTPNDPYSGRTAPLTSKSCIVYIYSTNIGTEFLKHTIHSQFFFFSKCSLYHNSNVFGSCIIHILYTGCAKIPSKPNDPFSWRTAPLNSKRCILYIYSTNIGTEYFKHAIHSQFFLFKM
jgi:hypothetical protein